VKTSPGAAIAASLCLVAALAWAGALLIEPGPWNDGQVLVLAAGLVILATVALVGVVLKGSRWGRRMAGGLAVGELAVAMMVTISAWWWVAVGAAGATLALVGGPWLATAERHRTPQLGPPPRAVLLLCTLAAFPVGLAAVAVNGLGGAWVLAGLSAATAVGYSKALPGSLFSARFIVPIAAAVATLTTPWPGWPAVAVGGTLVAWAAWSEESRLAVRPLVDNLPVPAPEPTPLTIRSARDTGPPRRPTDQTEDQLQ
jgi:hypothetical protein